MSKGVVRWAEKAFDLGFVGVTALWGVLFLLDRVRWIFISPPVGVLLMALWCPFFWWRYWRARVEGVRGAWFLLACSAALTGLTVVAAFVVLIQIARG